MLWSATSEDGVNGNLLEASDDLRGDDFAGDGLSGDDLDGEDLAWEARCFRRVDMVAW